MTPQTKAGMTLKEALERWEVEPWSTILSKKVIVAQADCIRLLRVALQDVAKTLAHNGTSGNEYRRPVEIRLHELANQTLSATDPDKVMI